MTFYTFIPRLLNMSLTASVVILFVLVARLILKRTPKVFSYALWVIVLLRLLVPVTISSPVSIMPASQTATSETVNTALPDFVFETPWDAQENKLSIQQAAEEGNPVTVAVYTSLEPVQYLGLAWIAGMAVMMLYSFFSYRKIRKSIHIALSLRDNIYIADEIKSPFVIGLLKPKIYLPATLTEEEQSYIILHEQHHIRRGDHIFKALAFIALCLHWFNPLVWVAFILAGKDMEMSCDEAVIRKVGSHVRADYSASLLTLATGRRIIAGTPLAFGEGDTKGRIHNLARWKKPARWIVILSVVLCLILAVCLLTNPAQGMPLYEIDGRNNYSDSLDDRETIEIISNGKEASVTDLEGFLKALDEIKVSRKAIDQSRSEDRDSTHQIVLDGQYEINFSWSYSTVWIDNHVKPTFTYLVTNPLYVADIVKAYSSEVAVDNNANPWGISLIAENITPISARITMKQDGGYLPNRLIYGSNYGIEKYEDGQWIAVQPLHELYWTTVAYSVPLNDSVTWNIDWSDSYGTLEPGLYRFCKSITEHHAPGDNDSIIFYAEFEILD